MNISIYTDGACVKNPGGAGAWAYVVASDDPAIFHTKSGYEDKTTNNIMEMTGVLEAIEYAKEAFLPPIQVTIFSDSQYVVKGINEWMPEWKRKGWSKKNGPIKNLHLWKRIDSTLTNTSNIKFQWVRGHAGHRWNEMADQLCTAMIIGNKASEDVSEIISGCTEIPDNLPEHLRHIIEFRNKIYTEKAMKYTSLDKLDEEFTDLDNAIYQVLVDSGFERK